VSIPDRDELSLYDMHDCKCNDLLFDYKILFIFIRSRLVLRAILFPTKRNVAMRVFKKSPETLSTHMHYVMDSKNSVSTERKRFARPVISQEDVDIFLQQLHSQVGDTPNLLDVAMLKHLKTTSISDDNIKRAARGA
jgi:hypothetical protein